jgi:hypothetical protein
MLNQLHSTADRLPAIRGLLAQLHRTLLDAERRELERDEGRVSSGQYLGLLLNDPRFQWLRPLGRMVARLDEVIAEAETGNHPISELEAGLLLDEVSQIVMLRTGLEGGLRYMDWLQREPEVVLAHAALTQALKPRPAAWAA